MAKFEITAPDGSVYEVEGDNEEGALQALQQHLGQRQPEPAQQGQNWADNAPSADQRQGRPIAAISALRQKYPQYNDLSDQQLADAFHKKFYSDMPQDDFYSRLGFNPQQQPEPKRAETGGPAAPTDASTVFSDEMLFGLAGKASAGLNALAQRGIAAVSGGTPWEGKSVSELYDANRGAYNGARERYAEQHPIANTAATIGGNVFGAVATSPASLTRLVPQGAGTIGRFAGMTAGTAVDGVVTGAASAYGHDENVGKGALTGGALGSVSYPFVQAASTAFRPLASMFGIGNNARAQIYVNEALKRSGSTADDIAALLTGAKADGQGMFTVADAMGNSGQRALSGVARSPGDMRQVIAETLDARQSGQGRRIANALSEGFGAPDTAAQRAAALTTERTAQASQNYGAARAGAGAVDPSHAISMADDFLMPGASKVLNPGNAIADDSIEAAVRRARSYLTDGSSVLTDFNATFRAKMELDAMIEGARPAVQAQLIPIRNALDGALEKASPNYATARNTFRQQSKAIDAVDTGKTAATRGRYEDTIPTFNAMSPQEQGAFRAGYSDPLIAQAQGGAIGANKARPLINDATRAEFPAFAAPGKAQQLGDRLAREHTMFETRNTALGGSKTADNLSDMGEAAGIDPTMIGNLMKGRWGAFLGDVIRHGSNAVTGKNEAVRDHIAKMLLETNPQAASQLLTKGLQGGQQSQQLRSTLARMLTGGSVPAAISATK